MYRCLRCAMDSGWACAGVGAIRGRFFSCHALFRGVSGARAGGGYMENFYLPPAPSSTPWYPSWHPDGKHIAVAMQGSVWSVEVSTGIATQLVSGPKYYSSPNYSPDGRWLVYTADEHGGEIGLEILNTETGETQPLGERSLHLFADPRFSPDGTRIAYVRRSRPGISMCISARFRRGGGPGARCRHAG